MNEPMVFKVLFIGSLYRGQIGTKFCDCPVSVISVPRGWLGKLGLSYVPPIFHSFYCYKFSDVSFMVCFPFSSVCGLDISAEYNAIFLLLTRP